MTTDKSTTEPVTPQPPGQQRSLPKPTSTGKVPFTDSRTGLESETYYKLWGDLSSNKTPLICLHGGPGVPHPYILPICLLHTDYDIPVLMYDQIGCGKSSHFPDKKGDTKFWVPELFMAELNNLKSHFGIKEFDLLGQSWGGMLAAQYAIVQQAKGLRKLILSNSPTDMKLFVGACGRLRKELPQDVQETLDRCEREGKTETEEYENAVLVFYQRYTCRVDPFPDELNDSFGQLKEDNTVYDTMNGPSEFHVIGSLKGWSITEDVGKITKETAPGGILIMNGVYDEAQDETMEAFFHKPSCRVKWVQFGMSSHTPMLEETERYVSKLGRFLLEE